MKKLGEIATFSKGKGISKSDIEEDGITDCIRYGELYTHYGEVINCVKSKTNVNTSALVISEVNDVIIPASGETAIDIATASCVLKAGVALGGDLNIIKTKNNGVFLSYYLNSKKKMEIANLAQGISVVHLYSSQLSSLTLSLPKFNEQDRISSFLALLDERIQTQSKIIKELKVLKTSITKRIFSRQLKFKDKDGNYYPDWQTKKLGDIGNVKMCRRIFNEETFPSGDIPFFKIGSFGREPDAYITNKLFSDYKQKFSFPKKGDILISAAGTIGRTVVYQGEDAYFQDSNIVWIDND
ncbi:restriction endonuclease subunit S, partial [Chryseobacterium sp.]|uniref:restriction endonuclease subunit S n=1 Tax=Chryseobacterium sp. TaxID=1871047 RepID=UPI002FC839CF